MTPARGLLLVRPIDAEDTISGGSIIVPPTAKERMTAHQCEVVAIGAPETCEDEDCERIHNWTPQRPPEVFGRWSQRRGKRRVAWETENCEHYEQRRDAIYSHPCPITPGDWLLIRPRTFIDTDTPERKLWLVRQSDVLAVIDD